MRGGEIHYRPLERWREILTMQMCTQECQAPGRSRHWRIDGPVKHGPVVRPDAAGVDRGRGTASMGLCLGLCACSSQG